jgi:CheY-like chemotaxis protein
MKKIKVMIVEDEVITARAMHMALKMMGYVTCSMVMTGPDAIEKSGQEKPDVILMDINLKGDMDGIEAAEEISDRFAIPIIFLTGYPDDEMKGGSEISKKYRYLVKPAEPDDIKSMIDLIFDQNVCSESL